MNTPTRSTNSSSSSSRQARMPLATRIVIGILSLLALAAAVIAGINISLLSSFNSSTRDLQSNIASFNSSASSMSINQLKALTQKQKSLDQSLSDLQSRSSLASSRVKKSISHNAAISRQFTQKVATLLKEKEKKTGRKIDTAQKPTSSSSASSSSSSSQSKNTEDEQKAKKLLKRNTTKQTAKPNSSKSASSQTKPW